MRIEQLSDHAQRAPEEAVNGVAWVNSLSGAGGPSSLKIDDVHFAPNSRTAWHSHPLGQVLVVTAGVGWVQAVGAQPQRISVGDIVTVAPQEVHWHGACETTGMTHIAIQQLGVDGAEATVYEHLTDRQIPERNG
jgi:quercetin dioxygenase-like cupin family protein